MADHIRAIRLCDGGETVTDGKAATACDYCTNGVCRQMQVCQPGCSTCGDIGMVTTVEYADSMHGYLSGMPCPDCTPAEGRP